MPARLERLNHRHHGAQIRLVGRPRILLGRLDAHDRAVFAERGDIPIRVFPQRDARFGGRMDRLVVDVREIRHLADAIAVLVCERAPQHVEADERAEIADVAAGVDGQSAVVHANGLAVGRNKVVR